MAGEMSCQNLSKRRQRQTPCRGLSDLRDLSRVGAWAGITTGATLERKLRAGYKDTFDQPDWCQAWISLLRLPEPRAKKKNSLEAQCFKEASLRGSNGALPIGAKPREGSRKGILLSKRRVRFSSC